MNPEQPTAFQVLIDKQVTARLRKIPPKHQNQIVKRIAELKNTPRPQDSIKLKSDNYDFRINIGEYRILYDVDYKACKVSVWRLLQRGEGYGRHHV